MQLTIKIKIKPTKGQASLLRSTMKEYIRLVNECISDMVTFNEYGKLTSKNVQAKLPSSVKNQCILDAKSAFRRYRKTGIEPVLRKPVAIWNNQNYRIEPNRLFFPLYIDGKTQRISVKAIIPDDVYQRLMSCTTGTLRITEKQGKFIAQVAIEQEERIPSGSGAVMGIDLGLKCPAVCSTDSGRIKFVGNGRKNKYIRRHFKVKHRKLGKAKKSNAIKKMHDKEQRIMRDIDHKISREIVNFAKQNNIGLIKMERLANIRQSARKSRKNEHHLHTWSFYRLAGYIEYKAKAEGIIVEYINPAYTSQICPVCGQRNHANDREYVCSCGYHCHRDIVGAKNICAA